MVSGGGPGCRDTQNLPTTFPGSPSIFAEGIHLYSPETQAKLALFRQKVADKTITDDELKEAIDILREERKAASISGMAKRAKARAIVRSAEDLLAELDGRPE